MSRHGKEVSKYLKKVQEGERAQLGKVFDLSANHLRVVAARYLSNESDVEDIVSDVFCKAMQYIHSFDPKQDGLNWLCRIAERTAYDYNEKEKALRDRNVNIDTIADKALEDGDRDEKIMLLTAMEKLSELDRDMVYDYFFAGETYDEIARKYGVVKSAAYKRVQKSLKFLNKFLKNGEQKA